MKSYYKQGFVLEPFNNLYIIYRQVVNIKYPFYWGYNIPPTLNHIP